MAQTILTYYSGGGSATGTSFQSNGQIRVTYTASNGTVKITELEGGRNDTYGPSYNASDKSVSITINGTTKTVSLGNYIYFANSLNWNTWNATDTSWTGLSSPGASSSDFNIKILTPSASSGSAYYNVTFSGTGTMSWSSYTVSYNANGGSGAPSSQTKYYGKSLTLSSTTPTRTGYKFLGWSASSTATSATYSAGGSYTDNSGTTLYAVWEEYYLTVNYYSNYATGSSDGVTNAVGSSKNVLVKTGTFYYDNDYSTYGLANYTSTSNSFYLTRTGYTGTGYWGTTTSGGTTVHQDTGFATGQKLAEAFGKSLASGNASVNVYAQWRENKLTVTYYSNYADYFKSGSSYTPLNTVGADKNVAVYKYEFKYATAYNSTSTSEGLFNYSNEAGALYMTRTRYDATGFWCTTTAEDVKLEGDKTSILSYTQEDGTTGIAIGENKTFASGQALAEALGLSLASGDKSINLYANWVLLASKITVYQSDGTPIKGLCHIYDENNVLHYAILTVYDENGNAREVI